MLSQLIDQIIFADHNEGKPICF